MSWCGPSKGTLGSCSHARPPELWCLCCAGGFGPPQEAFVWGRLISALASGGPRFPLLNVPETNHGLKIMQLQSRRGNGCELLPPQHGEERELVLFQLCEAAVLSFCK